MQSTSNAKVSHVQSTLHVALWHNTSLAPEICSWLQKAWEMATIGIPLQINTTQNLW